MDALQGVRSIVLKPSESLDEGRFTRIAGADFNDAGLGLSGMLASLATTGFQASNLGDAVDVVNQMNGGCPMRSHVRTVMNLSLTLHIENL
jgi:deoxyhypusine synthase